jgi:hypothetical protein
VPPTTECLADGLGRLAACQKKHKFLSEQGLHRPDGISKRYVPSIYHLSNTMDAIGRGGLGRRCTKAASRRPFPRSPHRDIYPKLYLVAPAPRGRLSHLGANAGRQNLSSADAIVFFTLLISFPSPRNVPSTSAGSPVWQTVSPRAPPELAAQYRRPRPLPPVHSPPIPQNTAMPPGLLNLTSLVQYKMAPP